MVIEQNWMKRGLDGPGWNKEHQILAFCFSGGSKSNDWILNIQVFSIKKSAFFHCIFFTKVKGWLSAITAII